MLSQHAVPLDANFSKYGYSAHLRTHDAPTASSDSPFFDKEAWHAERKLGSFMHVYQKPVVRQYFHKGLLWRASEAQEVASYELFIDLFYVGIIAITGDTAAEHPTGTSLLRFVITFTMGWKFWTDIGVLVSWFDSDDVLRRCSILFILTCLLGFTTNMASAFEHTYAPLVAFYVAARLSLTASMLWYAWVIPMIRGGMVANAVVTLVPAALWIASVHVEEPKRQALIWPAIAFDLFGGVLLIFVQRPGTWMAKYIPTQLRERLEFFPGTNIEHRIERTNAFVTLVFGSCVLGLLYQSNVEFGINAFFGKAVLGLVQAFVFNWIYFEIDSLNLHTHAIRRHVFSGKSLDLWRQAIPARLTATALTWGSIHLPFIMSFVLSASALGVLVRAHDCADAPLESLFETFISRSEDHISDSLQWFYCGGLGVNLFCLGIIALTHTHRKIPNQRIRKETRVVFRMLVSIIIITLPKAHMNSLQLVATTTGLIIAVLIMELIGSSCWGENMFWERGCGRDKATYSARCAVKREELEKSLKDGTVLDIEEIAKRESGEKVALTGV
jgi:low temperature requirement protein LtrA